MTPDFCIIGTPKSATSSLFSWLDTHPEIQGSKQKETFFLMDDEHPLHPSQGNNNRTLALTTHGADSYDNLFSATPHPRKRFEGTTHYYYQNTARDFFASSPLIPDLFLVLRNPSARILSSFRYTQENLGTIDRQLSFDDYVDCLLSGDIAHIEPYYHSKSSLWIASRQLDLGNYTKWINWWLEKVPADKLKVYTFDQLTRDPLSILIDISNTIGVSKTHWQNWSPTVHNETVTINSQLARRLATRFSRLIPDGKIRNSIKAGAKFLLHSRRPVAHTDYEMGLSRLDEYFRPLNTELRRLHFANHPSPLPQWLSD